MRIAWFDCFSGISGDMTLGALHSAGWEEGALRSLPLRLQLEHVRVEIAPARRGPFAATQVQVLIDDTKQPHRHLHHIEAMLDAAEIVPAVRERAKAVFLRLAEAEAAVHGSTVEQVHFHEVGAADALVDVVGSIEGLEALGVEAVYASPPVLGRGEVDSQHGRIPVPAPATALLLRGAPVEIGDLPFELTTPTGAALLATLVRDWASPPRFTIERIGVGAGGRDPAARPNVLRVMIGTRLESAVGARRVSVLETAVDDENPQFVAALQSRLLALGALDVMVVPAVMKKGRAGLWIVALTEPEREAAVARELLSGSTTLGVRVRREERLELERRLEQVETAYGAVTLKVASLPGGTERAVPEFESVREAAERTGEPLRAIAEAALAAWRAATRP